MKGRIIVGLSAMALSVGTALVAAPDAQAYQPQYCGNNPANGRQVFVLNGVTSCSFALNTAKQYSAVGQGANPFNVYSPTTGSTYTMRCNAAQNGAINRVCTGGNNAAVGLG